MSNSLYPFTVTRNDVTALLANFTQQSISFPAGSFPIPPGVLPKGYPTTLDGLINLIGPNNVKMTHYVTATGTVGQYYGSAAYQLFATAQFANGNTSNSVQIATDLGSSGGQLPLPPVWQNLKNDGNPSTNWIIKSLTFDSHYSTYNACWGIGKTYCDSVYGTYTGWSGVEVDVKIDVVADLSSCPDPSNCKGSKGDHCDPSDCSGNCPDPSICKGDNGGGGNGNKGDNGGGGGNGSKGDQGENFFKKYWWIFLIVFLLLLIIIVVVIVITKKKKPSTHPKIHTTRTARTIHYD